MWREDLQKILENEDIREVMKEIHEHCIDTIDNVGYDEHVEFWQDVSSIIGDAVTKLEDL